MTERGAAEIDWLERATLSDLSAGATTRRLPRVPLHRSRRVRRDPGHRRAPASRTSRKESAGQRAELGTMLADEDTLRLAVLNSCEGARTSSDGSVRRASRRASCSGRFPPSSRCSSRSPIDAAIVFAEEFYAAIADGYPVDSALAEARRMIYAERQRDRMGDAGALHARRRRTHLRRRRTGPASPA